MEFLMVLFEFFCFISFIDQSSSISTMSTNSSHPQRPPLTLRYMIRFSMIYLLYHVIRICYLSQPQTTPLPYLIYLHKIVLGHHVLPGPYFIKALIIHF